MNNTKIVSKTMFVMCQHFTVFLFVVSLIMYFPNQDATAQDCTQDSTKLLASDGEENDVFSSSISCSGNLVIVGAYGDDDNGSGSGAAYIFDTGTYQQLRKLLPSDGSADDSFGISASMDGNLAVVGAYGDTDNGLFSGSAYVFDVTTGLQLYKLLPDDGSDFNVFGCAAAISGNLAVIGASGDDDNGNYSGSAYIFDVTTGRQLYKLLPNDGDNDDEFGSAVAISGNLIIVGAYGNDDQGLSSGSAYIFDASTGKQIIKLLPSDGMPGDEFGSAVAVSESHILIGAWADDDNGPYAGSAYVFSATTGQQLYKLLSQDGEDSDQFGVALAISDSLAVIGADMDDDNGNRSGSAYIFDVTTGEQLNKLLPMDGASQDEFGSSVAIGDNMVCVGAGGNTDNGPFTGSAYIFDLNTPVCPTLDISPFPLIGGQDATFSVINTKPDTKTYLAYSLQGPGTTYVGHLNVTLNIRRPVQAGDTIFSNWKGKGKWVLRIPSKYVGRSVWFQACQYELKTNVVSTEIQ